MTSAAAPFIKMAPKNTLDLKGIVSAHPIAEVMVEIYHAGLSGSLRIESGEKKSVVYFSDGRAAHAISNERKFRLAEVLLAEEAIDRSLILENRNVSNDLQLAEQLIGSEKMSKADVDRAISKLAGSVIASVVTWSDGEWTFSPHARLRSDINFNIELQSILMEHVEGISIKEVEDRLKNSNDRFELGPGHQNEYPLRPAEAFILSRLDSAPLTLDQLEAICGQLREDFLSSVYRLWFSGLLIRRGGSMVFSEERIAYLKSANLELKKPVSAAPNGRLTSVPAEANEVVQEETEDDTSEIDLETSLKQVESAKNYYEVLSVEPSAKIAAIRKAYFKMAKVLHPDRYRSEGTEKLLQIEKAFAELAQAHETLKNPESRQNYDIRMKQEERDREIPDAPSGETGRQRDLAAKAFERGMALQLEGEFGAAVPYFARASYYSPDNARYHAHYGKALSMDEDQRHKAEKELVAAVRLDPSCESHRLMLAEFFIRYKLMRRAVGELNRLLEISPENKEAKSLLDSLQVK